MLNSTTSRRYVSSSIRRPNGSYVFNPNVNNDCVKSVQIRRYFWFVFSCIRTEYRKIQTINNSVFEHFSRSKWLKRYRNSKYRSRGGSRAAATSKMERFVIIVNGLKPLTIITKRSILDVAATLDPSLRRGRLCLFDRWMQLNEWNSEVTNLNFYISDQWAVNIAIALQLNFEWALWKHLLDITYNV